MGVFLFILLQGGLSEAVTYIFKYLVGLWNSYFPPLIFAHFMKYIRDTKCLRELQTAERKSLSVNLSALLIEGNLTVRTLETKRGEGAQRGCVEKPDYDLCPVGHPHVRTRTHAHTHMSKTAGWRLSVTELSFTGTSLVWSPRLMWNMMRFTLGHRTDGDWFYLFFYFDQNQENKKYVDTEFSMESKWQNNVKNSLLTPMRQMRI